MTLISKNLCSIILADCGEQIDESELKGLEYNELSISLLKFLVQDTTEKMSSAKRRSKEEI